jgi:DNA-binding transcriptional MerR regulator
MRTIGQVAAEAGVSVRTLHHWEQVGLVPPPARRGNGYRAYDEAHVARVRAAVAWRALGLSLEDIRLLLESGATTQVLEEQLRHLDTEQHRLEQVRRAVVQALEARRMGIELDPAEIREVFGDEDPAQHASEAEQRWGDTEAWAESQRRTSSYTKEDWLRMRAEQEDLEARMAEAMRNGEDGRDLALEHRALMTRWFHDVSPEMHVQLAEMYVGDERFTAHYDRRAPGLAQWLRDAVVQAYA